MALADFPAAASSGGGVSWRRQNWKAASFGGGSTAFFGAAVGVGKMGV